METLTIKELAPYIPYGLKGILTQDLRDDFYDCDWVGDINIFDKGSIWKYAGYADKDLSIPLGEGDFSGFLIRNGYTYTCVGNSIKPLLRPLSDLTKEIEVNGTVVKPINILYTLNKGYENSPWDELAQTVTIKEWLTQIPYWAFEYLLSIHIDVFGLIPKGRAIDLNTIKETE